MSKPVRSLVTLALLALAPATPCSALEDLLVEALEPGAADRLVRIGGRCPTFHWGVQESASVVAFDLQILQVESGDVDLSTREVHRRLVPAVARMWTPDLSECLVADAVYGWRIRAVAPDETPGDWSVVRYFELTDDLTAAQLDRVLAFVRDSVETDRAPTPTAVGPLGRDATVEPSATLAPLDSTQFASSINVGASAVGLRAVGESDSQSIGVVGVTESELDGSVGLVGEAVGLGGAIVGVAGLAASPTGVAGVFDNLAAGQVLSGRSAGVEVFAVGGAGDVAAASFAGDGAALANVDAETLDGLDSTDFMPADADDWVDTTGDTMTGDLIMQGADVDLGTGDGAIRRGPDLFAHNRGSGSAALGRQALNPTATGEGNTAVGDRALSALTSGFSNTAIGRDALRDNLIGVHNTGVGDSVLRNNIATGNTAVGAFAMQGNDNGFANTAVGATALNANVSGSSNVAVGSVAMFSNTSGFSNTAVGADALQTNGQGSYNTAIGEDALRSNTTGSSNTALGSDALRNSNGSGNVAIGAQAGGLLTTGSDNVMIASAGDAADSATIRIGDADQTRAFVAGIRGVTTAANDALPVLIDSNGQLGTLSSSARYKSDVSDIADGSAALHRLRPVSFRYLAHGSRGPAQFGLIAEEVAEVFPELVVFDDEGRPQGVRYQSLEALLLNELQKLARRLRDLEGRLSGADVGRSD